MQFPAYQGQSLGEPSCGVEPVEDVTGAGKIAVDGCSIGAGTVRDNSFDGSSEMSGELGIRRSEGGSSIIAIHIREEDPVETNGRRMCELLVGLGEVGLVGVEELAGDRLRVTIRSRGPRPVCGQCGGRVWSKGDQPVRLVDLPAFGRPVRLRWRITPLGVPKPKVWCEVVRGTGPVGGCGTGFVDVSGRSVGHRAGGSPRAHDIRKWQRSWDVIGTR